MNEMWASLYQHSGSCFGIFLSFIHLHFVCIFPDIHTVQRRPEDQFQKKIEEIMKTIEEKMEKSKGTTL